MPMVPKTDFPNLTGDCTAQSSQLTSVRVGILRLGPSFYLGHSLLVKINPARLPLIVLLLLFLFSAFFSYFSSSSSPSSWYQCSRKDALTDLQVFLLLMIQEDKNLTGYNEAFLWWAIEKLCMKWEFHGERRNNMLSRLVLVCWLPGSPSQGQGCWVPGLSKTLYNLVLLLHWLLAFNLWNEYNQGVLTGIM